MLLLRAVFFLGSITCAVALQTLPPTKWAYEDEAATFTFNPATHQTVYISHEAAKTRDEDGLTMIPPSGLEFAEVFAQDLQEMFGRRFRVKKTDRKPKDGIFLDVLGDSDRRLSTYESGETTTEGYELAVGRKTVLISGAGARGIFWGTRTLLQELRLAQDKEEGVRLRTGRTKDVPAFAIRGFMLDAGRKWYSPQFLKDLCTYASYFKLSEFHYHLSDNYPLNRGKNDTWNEVYSQFSLWPENPDLQGLITRKNETLTRADFEDFQRHCALRGVTVIPEIEAPGHSLYLTKWKPQLALPKKDLLNLTHPETIPTVKAIWAEFLPWFKVKQVHIGADEYDKTYEDDYVSFVNEMNRFIKQQSGKSIRIWGTHGDAMFRIDKDITIQHWQYGESEPRDLPAAGYNIINSEDWWGYTSLKSDHTPILPAPYPQFFNTTRTLNFGNVPGWQWTPNLVNPFNTTAKWQIPERSRRLKGAIIASWNDSGPDATTQLEAFYAVRDGIPVVAARMWCGNRGPRLETRRLENTAEMLKRAAPGQNLDRVLPTKRDGLVLDWGPHPRKKGVVGMGSKGSNHTLEIQYKGPFVMHGPDTTLTLTAEGELEYNADGFVYPLRHVDEEAGYDPGHPGRIWWNETGSSHEPVKVPLRGELVLRTDVIGGTQVWDGKGMFMGRFEVFIYGGRNTVFSWQQMAFVAPLEKVKGAVKRLRVWDGLR